jgi:lipopolysaccharide/colanic/teichoic acid biosynthesis glycosyltransferase
MQGNYKGSDKEILKSPTAGLVVDLADLDHASILPTSAGSHELTTPVNTDFCSGEAVQNVVSHQCLKIVYVNPHAELDFKIRVIKRIFDLLFSVVVMILGLPAFAILYLITKFSSAGPAFYRQERVGKNERRFHIYKFRSMHTDAEKFGPQLSSADDPRITSWGRIIRRTRLDELPQFWNVLKGDMSVVGPRPERQHFIDLIVGRNPEYKKLQRLKPGVTSMGQVNFGYAENVDQMCARMVYDLNYLQRPTIKTDLKVIFKTIHVMVQCKGK